MVISAIIIILSSVWVYFDSKKMWDNPAIDQKKEKSPGDWLGGCLFLWIIAFPYYLIRTVKLKKIAPYTSITMTVVLWSVFMTAFLANAFWPFIKQMATPADVITSAQVDQNQIDLAEILDLDKKIMDALHDGVLDSVRQTFAKNPNTAKIKVESLTLVHEHGGHYIGVLNVVSEGSISNLVIDVTSDADNFIWQLK